jgi:hypothetical protein
MIAAVVVTCVLAAILNPIVAQFAQFAQFAQVQP